MAVSEMRGKAGDDNDDDVKAELFKVDCPMLRELMLDAFNDILDPRVDLPPDWLSTKISVLYKKATQRSHQTTVR